METDSHFVKMRTKFNLYKNKIPYNNLLTNQLIKGKQIAPQ